LRGFWYVSKLGFNDLKASGLSPLSNPEQIVGFEKYREGTRPLLKI